MENLLSKRFKHLGLIVIGLAILSMVFFYFLKYSSLNKEKIDHFVLNDIEGIEETLSQKYNQYKSRAKYIFSLFQTGKLIDSDLKQNEALILFDNEGKIEKYHGEIYFYKFNKFKEINVNQWLLFINKKRFVYFVQKLKENIFFIKYFFNLENNFIQKKLTFPFSVKDLKFSEYINKTKGTAQYDEIKEMYFYRHLLKYSKNQLILNLKLSKSSIKNFYARKRQLFFYMFILLCLWSLLYLVKKISHRFQNFNSFIIFTGIFVNLFFLVKQFVSHNLYLKFLNFNFNSTIEILILLLFLIYILYMLSSGIKSKTIAFILFNITTIFIIYFSNQLIKSVNFFYADFNFNYNYLSLVIDLFLLHLLLLIFIKRINIKKNGANIAFFLFLQIIFILICLLKIEVTKTNVFGLIILGSILFISFFFKKNFLLKVIILFLISFSISNLILKNAVENRKEFITNNLKNIFSNQMNYAKFISREIVYELNKRGSQFADLFQKDMNSMLAEVWRDSFASKESIASGIFVVSKDGELANHFIYQIPYLRVKTKNIFPFWAIEDATAELYGKKISLAAATIGIYKRSEYLGYIIVQVLNSPELILRHQDETNIFTLNERIKGMELSYIKLNQEGQIIENPSNINLEDIAGILKNNNKWVKFKFMDLNFKGYIFRHNNHSIIIFYLKNTQVKNFSGALITFLFLFLFFILFNLKEIKQMKWRSFYYSFSIRVFVILILISIFTAIVFSIFSLNFNTQLAEREFRKILYERGRTVQNIVYNLIEEKKQLDQRDLLPLSKILNTDISVYENEVWWDTSDYKKIINARLPIYLHSNILYLLNQKNQKFVLLRDENKFNLFFKIFNYTFNIEFPYKRYDIFSGKGSYSDFVITLFFILAIIGISSAFFFRNKILSPIHELNRGMSEVEKGKLYKLKKIPSEIEIKSLYLGFNSMVEGIKEQKRNISEISRMKTLIKLGRRVAHEVKNPLTPIKLSAEQILKSLIDKNKDYEKIIKKSVNFIIDETDHLKKVSYGFLDLSRLDEINTEEFNLYNLVKEELFRFEQIYAKVKFSIDGDSDSMFVSMDKVKIKQVIKNLLINSIEAIGEKKGEIQLTLKEKEKNVELKIIDNGVGMEKKELDIIFNLDYSTKKIGTGLGLYIVKRIVELHKGKIEIKSEKKKGTTVMLNLPKKCF